jgi:methyl halide transferase
MTTLDNDYWSLRYINNDAGWDTGSITKPLKEYFNQLQDKNIAILIPGCGNSYEAEYLLKNGFANITLIDISSVLCERLRQRLQAYLSQGLQIICGDFFEHQGEYDLIVEQTFFCALDPSLRKKYAEAIPALLNKRGKLAGLLFNKQFETNPPFGGSKDEYVKLFTQYFDIEIMEPCYNSIKPREGAELFIKMIKKA